MLWNPDDVREEGALGGGRRGVLERVHIETNLNVLGHRRRGVRRDRERERRRDFSEARQD